MESRAVGPLEYHDESQASHAARPPGRCPGHGRQPRGGRGRSGKGGLFWNAHHLW